MDDVNISNEERQITEEQMQEQTRIRAEKLQALVQAGQNPFVETRFDVTHHADEIIRDFEHLEGQEVCVAGRIMTKRGMGKVSFCDVHDQSGRIQIFTKIDALEPEDYAKWQKLDIGDLVGVVGEAFRTQKGEISVRTQSYVLLAKALRPLPHKFLGLKDTELRYRQRYVDLIINPEVRETFVKRSAIIREIRRLLDERDFIEVETPILNTIPGGAAARPFITHHNTLDIDLYLRIAPELYLKRLIVGGFERVYEIGRNFRNEGMDMKHNPEFTLMEIYQAYTDLYGMMDLAENLLSEVARTVVGTTQLDYQGTLISLEPPFTRMTMTEAVLEYAKADFSTVKTDEEAHALAKAFGVEPEAHFRKGEILNLFFEIYCEDKLVQPTFICDYPIEISPLTKAKPGNPALTERFELFIGGREYANAYSELNDPLDQRARFADQIKKRELGDDEAQLFDEDYCTALEYGLPPTGGMGIGIDRFVMLLTDRASIRDVLLFPTMKPIGEGRKGEGHGDK